MVEVIRTRPADDDHQVVTLSGCDGRFYRRKPCPNCPWRLDQTTGRFPAEAFRHSAETAYDMSDHRFGCHMTRSKIGATMMLKLRMGASPLDDRLVGPPNIFSGPEVAELCPLCLGDGKLRTPVGELAWCGRCQGSGKYDD